MSTDPTVMSEDAFRSWLVLKPVDGRELARSLASGMVECFSQPSFRAGMVGSSVVGAVCLQRGMGKLPTFLLMLMAHYAAAGLYEMAEDIRDDLHALASRETSSGTAG